MKKSIQATSVLGIIVSLATLGVTYWWLNKPIHENANATRVTASGEILRTNTKNRINSNHYSNQDHNNHAISSTSNSISQFNSHSTTNENLASIKTQKDSSITHQEEKVSRELTPLKFDKISEELQEKITKQIRLETTALGREEKRNSLNKISNILGNSVTTAEIISIVSKSIPGSRNLVYSSVYEWVDSTGSVLTGNNIVTSFFQDSWCNEDQWNAETLFEVIKRSVASDIEKISNKTIVLKNSSAYARFYGSLKSTRARSCQQDQMISKI